MSVAKKVAKTKARKPVRTFTVIRQEDQSGVSGTGRVCDGIVFTTGKVVVNWRTDASSTAVYDSYEDFEEIHIKSHPDNKTVVLFALPDLESKVKEWRLHDKEIKVKEKALEEERKKLEAEKLKLEKEKENLKDGN
jgi:hypothetical protein